jgi:hypothetical protein
MSLSDSYTIPDEPSDNDDVDSLPSSTTDSFSSDDEDFDAQREWERSLEQLQLLLTMILVPFAGKYFGRKFAYWSMFRPPIFDLRAFTKITLYRLGEIHGMEARCRDNLDEQEGIQGCRSSRSGSNSINAVRWEHEPYVIYRHGT